MSDAESDNSSTTSFGDISVCEEIGQLIEQCESLHDHIHNSFQTLKNIHSLVENHNNINVINYGYVGRNKIYDLLEKSKIALTSEENFFSLFVIDAINCNLKIISFNNTFYNVNLKKYFFFIKENKNFFLIKNKIQKILSLNSKYDKNFKQRIYLQKKKINNFIRNIG
jgi:hypothetical protein